MGVPLLLVRCSLGRRRTDGLDAKRKFSDIDGADWLFEQLDGRPETYVSYAESYFERPVDYDAIAAVYRHEPLTNSVVGVLNPELSAASLAEEVEQIGYPSRSARGGAD